MYFQTLKIIIVLELPVGTIILFSASLSALSSPTYTWLLCDGSAVSRATYSDLYNVIGVTYGSGNGVDTFNVPDFRFRFPLGGNGSSSSLVSGGASTHTIAVAELPTHTHDQGTLATASNGAHTHAITDPGHNHGGSTGTAAFGSGSLTMTTTGGSGSVTGTHSHSIATDFTGITIQSVGNHTHTISGVTGSIGSNQAFSMMPPYQTINYIIRA